jgi:hypothetical protein
MAMVEETPTAGDVLITKRERDGHFEISIVPGDAQLSVRQKFEAVRHAHAFAAHTGASVWCIEPGGSYARVEKPRAKES